MSTNSTIRIKRFDGTETGIYCHWDGYIEGVGTVLQLFYNTPEKIEKLLALGDISSLQYFTNIESAKSAADHKNASNYTIDDLMKFVTTAYRRDKGETFKQTNSYNNEYEYTFNEFEGVWRVSYSACMPRTKAIDLLNLDFEYGRKDELLLDAILNVSYDKLYESDMFIDVNNIKNICIGNAKEARALSIEKLNNY